ncbi:DNA polymerase/3'-5' exonuclease PolX [Sediminibacterium roseum]|uniref:DNA polymerase/3'-5' exonuclease PolX n=1 Tax=Sediminibacterium roseum TaxID=1978412 RepID=A0ABW9ZT94_9BACT|nr:DNA polymerase/3'-5' exonuclease PolX [Sediminibacterium roseum]NCI49504.1 DNA polymerase/3'-5' exonuclease PolX [Sediminibacterium roseum]
MDNYAIAENFALLGKLMDIHGDNSFKAKSYASAAFTIDKLPTPLSELSPEKIFAIRGIGDSVGRKVVEQLETGELGILREYLEKTPPGILEMLNIKGIGPKKIATIWKELEVESLGELLYACNENRLTLYKGFGEKTQNNIRESIEFYFGTLGSYLYQQIEPFATAVDQKLKSSFPGEQFSFTGEYRRQLEIVNTLEWVTTVPVPGLKAFFTGNGYEVISETGEYISVKGKENVTMGFHSTEEENFATQLFATSCSEAFLRAWGAATYWDAGAAYGSEEEIFSAVNCHFIPAFQRENPEIIHKALAAPLPQVIQPGDITAIIHSHSNWSDGVHTLEQMATHAQQQGLQYLVISDHSKTAFYANGLSEERVFAQHQQINELNTRLSPFKIFKSIESDILNDGNLDYSNEVLGSFDLVIASVHSNLKMTEEKAMMRLLKAIENPYTSILGHMTGRLLLSRNGYPVDHKKIVDACAANNVVIEVNAHPRRLDIDWRWIEYALEKNVLISIDPDAHATDGYDDCRYGILIAQKGGLTKERNLSSFSLEDFEQFLVGQRAKRPRS